MQFVWSATSQRVLADILRHNHEHKTNKDLLQDAIELELMETSREKTYAGNHYEFLLMLIMKYLQASTFKPVE